MSQDARSMFGRILAYGFAATPVGFGALRLIATGNDFRYVVTAIASLATAATIFHLGANRLSSRWLLAIFALTGSTLVGGAIAAAQGASSVASVLVVTLSFGLCVTMSGMLGAFSRSAG